MDGSIVTELITKANKSNDTDAKVDAVTKLQAEFEAGVEIPDPDALLNLLKTCLRTSNQHLTTATISAIPPLLPLLITISPAQPQKQHAPSNSTSSSSVATTIDAFSLRQVLLAFLPAGGILDRLGDTRDKPREKARESLVILGGYAFKCGGSSSLLSKSRDPKGPETPLTIFDRFLKEAGLNSKVWRVREQSILTLVEIRRSHHLFPIRAYLSSLVTALEDQDGKVRECARQSVVSLFTGPGVTDAARSDLKKEMTKKGVRKNTLDSVLSQVLLGASTPQSDSEGGDSGSKKGYVPPSLALAGRRPTVNSSTSNTSVAASSHVRTASRGSVKDLSRPPSRAAVASPTLTESVGSGAAAGGGAVDVRPIYVASSRDLEAEFSKMQPHFVGKETEHNWAPREKSIITVRGMLQGEVHIRYQDTFLVLLKPFLDWSLKTLASLRTTVAAHTCSLYTELALALGTLLDPFCDVLLSNLLRMGALTKKLVAQQSQAAVTTIMQHTSALPRLIPGLLWTTSQEKTVQARAFVAAHIKTYLEIHAQRSKHSIESNGALEILEKCVKKSLIDANVGVRENARKAFWVLEGVWKDRGAAIMDSLDGPGRKQLEKSCPHPGRSTPETPAPSAAKKSSIAAAIAASRAKAKAIAIDPPTLRHQATAASQTAARISSPKRSMSPSLSNSSSDGRVSNNLSNSPPRIRAAVTGTLSRSTSGSMVGNSRTPRPVLPLQNSPPTARRISSGPRPASPGSSPTLRRAITTPMPASPPTPMVNVVPSTPTPQPRVHTRGPVAAAHAAMMRQSLSLDQFNHDDESLLLATSIPIPDEDEDDREDFNPVTFSTPFELYHPKSNSQTASPKSIGSKPMAMSNSFNSPPPSTPQPIVEDAMRARAEQAESAAERLLELVEPDDEGALDTTIPALLIKNGHQGYPAPTNGNGQRRANATPPQMPKTPVHNKVMRQAALFQDSPVQNVPKPSLLDLVTNKKHERGWWVKRMTLVQHGTPLKGVEPADRVLELQNYISALESGSADLRTLQKLALLCVENPVDDVSLSPLSQSPSFGVASLPLIGGSRQVPSLGADMWKDGKNCDKLFTALVNFLEPTREEDELEYGLIVLWEMLESQAPYLEGREADMFSLLLQIRYSGKPNVLEATNAIRDALTTRIEPVYGLTTMHASVRSFVAAPHHSASNEDVKAAILAFGLIALGKFILRLPGEILEEELPRLKVTLITALSDPSSLLVRESAAAVMISAQIVLRDEAHLFALLDGLADDKKNLLTYLFERHDARDTTVNGGMGKLEKEMKRLDTRTSTPPRSRPQ